MILVTSFDSECTSWNFQERCWHVHFFESAYNNAIENQAFIRVRWLSNPVKVRHLFPYVIDWTFSFFNTVNKIKKCIPKTTALLSRKIFENVGVENKGEIDIGQWVWCDGHSLDAHNPQVASLDFEVLSPVELLTKMMETRMGEHIDTQIKVRYTKSSDSLDAEVCWSILMAHKLK